jgi:hypothetical protein
MGIKDTIASAGRNLHTIIITAREDNGPVETREAEPYSYRITQSSKLKQILSTNVVSHGKICSLVN